MLSVCFPSERARRYLKSLFGFQNCAVFTIVSSSLILYFVAVLRLRRKSSSRQTSPYAVRVSAHSKGASLPLLFPQKYFRLFAEAFLLHWNHLLKIIFRKKSILKKPISQLLILRIRKRLPAQNQRDKAWAATAQNLISRYSDRYFHCIISGLKSQ